MCIGVIYVKLSDDAWQLIIKMSKYFRKADSIIIVYTKLYLFVYLLIIKMSDLTCVNEQIGLALLFCINYVCLECTPDMSNPHRPKEII